MSNPNQVCFTPEPGDSNSFGASIAINDKYLAVGDPGANHVIIYTHDNSGQWVRTKQILPPTDLVSDRHDFIFGNKLELDEDFLIINGRKKNLESEIENLSGKERILSKYSDRRYLINLKKEIEVKPINLLIEKTQGLIKVNLLRKGNIEQIVLPENEEERFGSDIALHQNLLLIGSPSYTEAGRAWLFDLAQAKLKFFKLSPQNINSGTNDFGTTVAVSKQFAAVGHEGKSWFNIPNKYVKIPQKFIGTLIKNLNTGSTKVINSYGRLSLSGNILAIMRPSINDSNQTLLLNVFYLEEDITPHLIMRRTNVSNALVQNGFLILVKNIRDFNFSQICIEPLY